MRSSKSTSPSPPEGGSGNAWFGTEGRSICPAHKDGNVKKKKKRCDEGSKRQHKCYHVQESMGAIMAYWVVGVLLAVSTEGKVEKIVKAF